MQYLCASVKTEKIATVYLQFDTNSWQWVYLFAAVSVCGMVILIGCCKNLLKLFYLDPHYWMWYDHTVKSNCSTLCIPTRQWPCCLFLLRWYSCSRSYQQFSQQSRQPPLALLEIKGINTRLAVIKFSILLMDPVMFSF